MPWLKVELSVQQLQTSRQQQQQKCPTVPSHRFLLNINTFARLMAISTKIENEHANARPIGQALLSICYFVWHFEWINNNTWKIKFKKTHREHSPIDLISIFGTDFCCCCSFSRFSFSAFLDNSSLFLCTNFESNGHDPTKKYCSICTRIAFLLYTQPNNGIYAMKHHFI